MSLNKCHANQRDPSPTVCICLHGCDSNCLEKLASSLFLCCTNHITCWRMQKFGQPKVENLELQIKEPCCPGIQRVPFADAGGEISSLTKKNKWCGNSWEIHGGLRVKPSEGDTSDGQRFPFGRGKPCLGSAFPMSAHHCCYCTMAGYDWLPLFTRFLGEHMLILSSSMKGIKELTSNFG